MARTSVEHVTKGQGTKGRVTAGATTSYRHPFGIDYSFTSQITSNILAILNIGDSPLQFQHISVGPPIPRATAIVHISDDETTARPILNVEVERAAGRACRSTVTFDEQRWQLSVRRTKVRVSRLVDQGVGSGTIRGGVLDDL